ncbi:hypothetical protein BDY17DRAFT_348256 [Neohortaea acidophila]|uniref:Uncharacterized protein n=1 Tax=Neohortaea acidophila TaxID=245834 RepID=A0A6A6PN94_9PEZI|nr:uncharacterized protein BDY17DRAFT_348256 [Neohortaea acidophila]KAF2480727.1 hypothetical protein BDY17DRAFT_348256 [Neohortaea acidophila]
MALFAKDDDGFCYHIGGMETRDDWWAYSSRDDKTTAPRRGNRRWWTLDDGTDRVACQQGDWCVFKPMSEAGNWEFAMEYDEDTRNRGYYYLSLGGNWLCVDGSGALNFKGSGSYVLTQM